MLKIAVLVSGGGTNLQAIIDSIADGRITDTEIKVVISNNPKAKALERAAKAGIEVYVFLRNSMQIVRFLMMLCWKLSMPGVWISLYWQALWWLCQRR